MMMFSVLDNADFDHLLRPINNIRLKKGDLLFRQGDEPGQVVSVRRGLVKLVHLLPDGQARIVRLLGAGSAIGLEALLRTPYQQTAVALSELDVCLIPTASLQQLGQQKPQLQERLMAHWQAHLDQADRVITDLNTGTVRARVARLLLLLGDIARADQSVPLLISTEDIASIVSTTKESASRVMAEFRRRGAIERLAGGRFRFDEHALRMEFGARAGATDQD